MKDILKPIMFSMIAVFVFFNNLAAHPHIAIDSHPVFVFDEEYFKGIRVIWKWDELFSEQVVIDYDKNENDKFEPEELIELEKFFHNIKDYTYFSKIYINDKIIENIRIENFIADFNTEECILTYTYFIPINIKLTDSDVNIVYINNDPTIYVSFSTECNAEKIDEEIENVDVFNSNVDAFSYYGYKFSIVVSKND